MMFCLECKGAKTVFRFALDGFGLCPHCCGTGYEPNLERGAVYFDREPSTALSADDVRAARLDRDAFGRVHQEIRFAVLLQVMRSIATEQPGASSAVKALAEAAIEVIDERVT